jgi:hypothetical protein
MRTQIWGACPKSGDEMDGKARQGCLCGVALASLAVLLFSLLSFPNIGGGLSFGGVGFADTIRPDT